MQREPNLSELIAMRITQISKFDDLANTAGRTKPGESTLEKRVRILKTAAPKLLMNIRKAHNQWVTHWCTKTIACMDALVRVTTKFQEVKEVTEEPQKTIASPIAASRNMLHVQIKTDGNMKSDSIKAQTSLHQELTKRAC